MRTASLLALAALLTTSAASRAAPPAPLGRWTPPEGHFFDDPIALSADGTRVAAISTDAANPATLHLWVVGGTALSVAGLPVAVRALTFLGNERVLVVVRQEAREGVEKVVGLIASVHGAALSVDKGRLGPADAIDVVNRDGKQLIALYTRGGKKNVEHQVQILAGDTLRPIARRTYAESAEGALRIRGGEARPLWWTRGHTNLSVQKLGEYDKARDIRRPDRFLRLDLVTDKPVEEHEIEDVLGFARVTLARKAGPSEAAFARLSDDHKQVLLLDGLDERPLSLERPIHLYDPDSLRSLILDEATLVVGLQVDPNNIVAVQRRTPDPDDFDLYTVERASIHEGTVRSRRALTLPGGGRRVGFTVDKGHVLVLRKDKGFDRGGVALELYPLP
jgi:hypothetical protein